MELDGFEWNAAKSEETRATRGLDFEVASLVFRDPKAKTIEQPTPHEFRLLTIGRVGDELLAVVWTHRGRNRRIISARLASRKERKVYDGDRPV